MMINFYLGKLSALFVGILQRDYFSVEDSVRYKMVSDSNFSDNFDMEVKSPRVRAMRATQVL